MRIFAWAVLVVACSGWITPYNTIEFQRFNGKSADPCHVGLSPMNPDCVYNQLPDPSVTILAPALSSFRNGAIQALAAGTQVARVSGHNIIAGTTITHVALSTRGGRCAATEGAVAAVTGGTAADPTFFTFTVPASWLTTSMELEEYPRSLCYANNAAAVTGTANQWVYTGFKWKVVWSCNGDVTNMACPPPSTTTDNKLVTSPGVLAADYAAYGLWPMNATYQQIRQARTQCCLSTVGAWGIGQCINPNVHTCCGGQSVSPSTQRCCNVQTEIVSYHDDACPCFRSTQATDCANVGETCCLPTKYPELSVATFVDQQGQCYNATTHQCCDTGLRFDPGTHQCCVINGIQSLDVPCPCATDSHCVGNWADTTDDASFSCCRQTSPVPYEAAFERRSDWTSTAATPARICDKYANYPNGTGPYQAQPCLGNCIDLRYQICCNGVACQSFLENCCNSTCCNKYNGACLHGFRPGSPGQWNNFNDFGTEFELCTTQESMNTVKAFWIFVLPTELMFATFAGLALALAFAARSQDSHAFSITERIMVGIAVLTTLFAITFFFAPIYKYGFVIVTVSLFAIITASARVRALNIVCVILQFIALMYIFDPMHGNYWLNFSSNRLANGNTDPQTMGILHTTANMHKSVTDVKTKHLCADYYNYFTFDRQLRDFERFHNPEVTAFGYCSRAWVVALYLCEGAVIVLVLVQFILDVLALIVRFKSPSYDPAQLAVQGKQE